MNGSSPQNVQCQPPLRQAASRCKQADECAVDKDVRTRTFATTDSMARPVKPSEQGKKLRSARIRAVNMDEVSWIIIAIILVYIPLMWGVHSLAERYGYYANRWVYLSLFVSPIICLIILLCLGEAEEKKLENQKNQQKSLGNVSSAKKNISIAEELEKLTKLKNDKSISEEEFRMLKNKLINS